MRAARRSPPFASDAMMCWVVPWGFRPVAAQGLQPQRQAGWVTAGGGGVIVHRSRRHIFVHVDPIPQLPPTSRRVRRRQGPGGTAASTSDRVMQHRRPGPCFMPSVRRHSQRHFPKVRRHRPRRMRRFPRASSTESRGNGSCRSGAM